MVLRSFFSLVLGNVKTFNARVACPGEGQLLLSIRISLQPSLRVFHLITLSGMSDNCSIKEGFDCLATIEGSTIYVDVIAKSESSADCICAVEDIETELSGLEYGKYTLVYTYKSSDGTITQEVTFDFSALLDMNVAFERTYVIPKS